MDDNIGSDDGFDASSIIPDTLPRDRTRKTDVYSTYCYLFSRRVVHFLKARKPAMRYILKATFYLFIPLVGIAACFFHLGNNPIGALGASYSWWALFVIRQCLTFMLAQVTQFICIDIIALETKLALMVFGRVITLIAMQAQGWPTILLTWATYNYCVLYGQEKYVQHCLYRQKSFGLFNDANPSGTVTSNACYGSLLLTFGLCAFLTMIKRVLVAILLGRKKYG